MTGSTGEPCTKPGSARGDRRQESIKACRIAPTLRIADSGGIVLTDLSRRAIIDASKGSHLENLN
jgi:hypothetical protein